MRFPIVGVNFRPADAREIVADLEIGEIVRLVRDPQNEYDPNAIPVHARDVHFVGFVPKGFAAQIADQMDEIHAADPDHLFQARVVERISRRDVVIEFEFDGN